MPNHQILSFQRHNFYTLDIQPQLHLLELRFAFFAQSNGISDNAAS